MAIHSAAQEDYCEYLEEQKTQARKIRKILTVIAYYVDTFGKLPETYEDAQDAYLYTTNADYRRACDFENLYF